MKETTLVDKVVAERPARWVRKSMAIDKFPREQLVALVTGYLTGTLTSTDIARACEFNSQNTAHLVAGFLRDEILAKRLKLRWTTKGTKGPETDG